MRRSPALVLVALLAGCGVLPGPVDSGQLPPGEFASGDPDVTAVNYAAAAFSANASTYGDPAAGAEAAVALEYSAGAMNTSPRWSGLDPDIKDQLLQARDALRATLGVAPGAPSQAVIDALATARRALQAGDAQAAAAALDSPVFTRPPAKTIEALGNLPYIQPANAATLRAAEAATGVAPAPPLTLGAVPF